MGLAESTTSPGTGRKSIAGSFAPFRGSVFQILNHTAYAVGYVLPPSGLNMIPQTFRCANRAPLLRRAPCALRCTVGTCFRATAETTSHFDAGCHGAPPLSRPRPASSGRLPHTHKNASRGVGTRQTQVSAPRWWLGSYFCAGPELAACFSAPVGAPGYLSLLLKR